MDLEGLAAFRASLAASGIDVVQPFDVRWYNEYIVSEGLPLKPLTTFGRKSGAVGVLVGNSKALWPAFLAWLAAQPRPSSTAFWGSSPVLASLGRLAGTSAAHVRRSSTQPSKA